MTPATPCTTPVAAVVERLRDRAADLGVALQGNVLILSIHLTSQMTTAYSFVFSPDGHVSLFTAGEPIFVRLRPHIRLQGSQDEVLRIILGETDAATAVFADQLQLSVTPAELTPHYGNVMRIVREEVWAVLEAGHTTE